MTLQKRLFHSNMMILCASLFSLLAVIVLVLVIFEDTIEKRIFTIGQSRIDPNMIEVQTILENAHVSDYTKIEKEIQDLQYELCVFKNGEIIQGSTSENMLEIVDAFQNEWNKQEVISLYYYRNATCVIKYDTDQDVYIIAAHVSDTTLKSSLKDMMWMWIFMIALIGMGTVALIVFLSSFFTKRMNRIVMEPLNELMLASERVSQGNLNEPIEYIGEEEFEQVTHAFNAMQETILKNEEARVDMVTGISHDLRTPLTSIQGYIKGVLDGVANTEEKKEQYLRTAYDSTLEMNILLQKLFDFSKLESGQLLFHFVKVDLGEYMDHWISMKKEYADFKYDRKQENLEIALDIDEFQRVLENLLENSLKYADTDPVVITIHVEQIENNVVLSWQDNGKGVQEDKIEHIFERFYRCDEARNIKGSGVGLYVVKYIIERHSGKVKAENENGLKLTFSFPHEGNTWKEY